MLLEGEPLSIRRIPAPKGVPMAAVKLRGCQSWARLWSIAKRTSQRRRARQIRAALYLLPSARFRLPVRVGRPPLTELPER